MRKGARITVCNLNFIGSDWKLINTERCGSCAFLGTSSTDCFTIEKMTEVNNNGPGSNGNPNSRNGQPRFIFNQKDRVIRSVLVPGINPSAPSSRNRPNRGNPYEASEATFDGTSIVAGGSEATKNYGKISYYSGRSGCKIYISGRYIGRTIYYFPNEIIPSCGEEGTFNIILPAGTYSYRWVEDIPNAFSSQKPSTFEGYITVEARKCSVEGIFVF